MKYLLSVLSTRSQSSLATEEGPKNLQADQDQAQPGGECVTSEEQPPQPTMPTKDQQEGWQSAKAKEIHPTESCQVTLGDEEEGMGTRGGGGKRPSLPPTQKDLCWWRLRTGAGRQSPWVPEWFWQLESQCSPQVLFPERPSGCLGDRAGRGLCDGCCWF